jgi:hypothetical protein
VLVPLTFVAGTAMAWLFARERNILPLALGQAILGALVWWAFPLAWHHSMRVGPGYLTFGRLGESTPRGWRERGLLWVGGTGNRNSGGEPPQSKIGKAQRLCGHGAPAFGGCCAPTTAAAIPRTDPSKLRVNLKGGHYKPKRKAPASESRRYKSRRNPRKGRTGLADSPSAMTARRRGWGCGNGGSSLP